MSNLTKQQSMSEVVKQSDERINTLQARISTEAITLSGITEIKDTDHSNSLVNIIREAKQPITEIDEIEKDVRRAIKGWTDQRQAKAEEAYKPLQLEIERVTKLRTDYVLEQERKAAELRAKQERDRANRQTASEASGNVNQYFISKALESRNAYIKQLEAFDSAEAIETFYATYTPKPTVKISQKHIQPQLDKFSPEIQALILEQLDFEQLSNTVNGLAKDNYEYLLGLKPAYINAINDAEERIRMQEQAKKEAAQLAEKQRLEAEQRAADLALEAELANQIQVQSVAQHNKNVRKKMALNQITGSQDLPIATFAELLNVFLHNGGDRDKLLKLFVPLFNKANKDKAEVVLNGFMWKEDITVAN